MGFSHLTGDCVDEMVIGKAIFIGGGCFVQLIVTCTLSKQRTFYFTDGINGRSSPSPSTFGTNPGWRLYSVHIVSVGAMNHLMHAGV